MREMCGIYMFDITILSIREIKMTKFRSRAIFREFKSLESSGYSNIRPSDIQISEYVRNSELHLRNPVAIPLDTRSGILVLRYDSAGIHETERDVDFISILCDRVRVRNAYIYFGSSLRRRRCRRRHALRPIRFKKLSIAVPRGVKRAEVPGACYVPTMRILRLRLSGVAYAIPSCRADIPDSAAPAVRTYVRFATGDEFGFYPDGKPEELYCAGRINPPLNRAAAFRQQIN